MILHVQNASESGDPPPGDAWFFARALAAQTIDTETRHVSEPNRPLAERMVGTATECRNQVWEDHLATLPEAVANSWIEAVAAANPGDPPPEDQSWGEPLSFELPPVLPFPLDVLPLPVTRLVRSVARAITCPPDFAAMTSLAVAGAAIGRSVSLRIKDGYFASSSIYAACVGQPGDGKSSAVSFLTSPMVRIDDAHFESWKNEKEKFDAAEAEREEAARNSRKGRSKRDRIDGEAAEDAASLDESSGSGQSRVSEKASPPILRRNVVGDATIEAMDALMEKNPRGLVQVLDELSTLISSMNQYRGGKGSDRQWYLSTWSGEPRIVDRKGNADFVPIRVPHPHLCLAGGMVPDMLGSFCDEQGRHDGFIDRILFTYPDQVPKAGWIEEGVTDDVRGDWSQIISRLQARPLIVEDLRTRPHVVQFSVAGKSAWMKLINDHHAEQSSVDFTPSLPGPWAKLEQYAGRLTLVLHLLGLAADPSSDDSRIPDVTERTVEAASRLLAYLKSHTRRVHEAIMARARGQEGSDDAQCIIKWIQRHSPVSFTVRDLTRDLTRTFGKRAHALQEALDWLEKNRWIKRQDTQGRPRKKAGRSKSPAYLVNPHLLSPQNRQNRDSASLQIQAGDSGDLATDQASEFEEDGDGAAQAF